MDGNNTEIDLDYLYGDLYDHLYAYDDFFDDLLGQEDAPHDHTFHYASISFRVALGAVYILIIIVCGVGNLAFLVVIGRFKKTRTKTNLLIANLALSDFVVAILCVPFSLDYYVINAGGWRYGGELCTLVNYVRMVSLHVSTNALVVIAIDRYITIVRHRWRRVGRTGAILVSVGVWITSFLIAIPSAKFSTVQPHFHQSSSFCGVVWHVRHITTYKGYYGSMLAFQFVLPVVIMAVCSLPVVWKVFHRELPGYLTDAMRKKVQRSKKKTLRLVLILALFVLCWAPYYVYAALRDFHHVLTLTSHNTNIFYAVEAAAMGNSVINTCVYVVFNKNVTNFVKILAKECRGLHQARGSDIQVMLPSDDDDDDDDDITFLSFITMGNASFRQNFDRCRETTL
ncbi:prokineticin receptor 2-like [Branchiostoma lanceolatum]|uniref:prokineticin receptor 2-like n=1 Tax=Branchiostoma lanceolatum TaxID=7740 RepID=UPI003455C19B